MVSLKNKICSSDLLFIGIILGVFISILIFKHEWLLPEKYDYDVDKFAGEYFYDGDITTSTANITEVLRQDSQREFKVNFTTSTMSGCTGEFEGYGIALKSKILFKTLNPHPCEISITPSKTTDAIEIVPTQECSYFSGARCGIYGTLERQSKFKFFGELEQYREEHPHTILKIGSINKAFLSLMGVDFNLLYDRITSADEKTGTFEGDLFCASGGMPGNYAWEKAIYCLDFQKGEAQSAVLTDNNIKIYAHGKLWENIADWAEDNAPSSE